jgi:hypothetical protein
LFSGNSIAVAIAVAVVLVVSLVVATSLAGIGDWDISPAGWVALVFGVIVTLALGIGLMALVFISSRRGYDELAGAAAGHSREAATAVVSGPPIYPPGIRCRTGFDQ